MLLDPVDSGRVGRYYPIMMRSISPCAVTAFVPLMRSTRGGALGLSPGNPAMSSSFRERKKSGRFGGLRNVKNLVDLVDSTLEKSSCALLSNVKILADSVDLVLKRKMYRRFGGFYGDLKRSGDGYFVKRNGHGRFAWQVNRKAEVGSEEGQGEQESRARRVGKGDR